MLTKTSFVVTMAMVVGTVACGGAPSDEGEATIDTAALTTPMALRFWDNGSCLESHGRGNAVTPETCNFSAPSSQKWAYEYNGTYGSFTIQQGTSCLIPNRASASSPPIMAACAGSDILETLWQIPDHVQSLPTQVSLFELRNLRNNACLTIYSIGGGRFALKHKTCEINRFNTDQTMMTDTFVSP